MGSQEQGLCVRLLPVGSTENHSVIALRVWLVWVCFFFLEGGGVGGLFFFETVHSVGIAPHVEQAV